MLFGAVLALNGADTATVGAVAPQLEQALHIGNTKIGLLVSVSLLVGAVFTIPVGLLVDRYKRMPMLRREHRAVERRVAAERVRRQLRGAAPDSARARARWPPPPARRSRR